VRCWLSRAVVSDSFNEPDNAKFGCNVWVWPSRWYLGAAFPACSVQYRSVLPDNHEAGFKIHQLTVYSYAGNIAQAIIQSGQTTGQLSAIANQDKASCTAYLTAEIALFLSMHLFVLDLIIRK